MLKEPVKRPQRTIRQNRALHLYFRLVAERLNEAGLDFKETLPIVDVPLNETLVKELMWRPIQKAQLGKDSTTQLTTKEIDLVFDTLNRFLAQKGLHESFPSIEALMEAVDELN